MTFALIVILQGAAATLGTYTDQGQCLHAAAYLDQSQQIETGTTAPSFAAYCVPVEADQ